MADEVPAPTPEVDVDALDDKAFEDLKGKIRREEPIEAPAKEEPAPKAETGDDDDEPAADANGKKQEFVPHAKFHQANERRKAAEDRATKAEADRVRALDRLQQLLEVNTQPQRAEPEAPSVPEWDSDPMQAGKWTQQQLLEIKQRLEGRDAEAQQRAQAEREWSAIIDAGQRQYAEAVQSDPSLSDAYDYLNGSYGAELRTLGYPQNEINQELARIEAQGIRYALQNRIPIGQYVSDLAAARGWKPKAPANDDPPKSEAEKITQREETRLASQSLGKAGGAVVNTGVITPEELLNMSDADFEAYKKKHGSVSHAFRQAS